MVGLYENHHVHDNDSILKMVQPLKYAQRDIAANIAEAAACFLEAHLSPKSALLETTAPSPKQVKRTRGTKQPSNTSSSTVIGLRSELSSLGDMALDDKQTDDTAIDEKKADDDDDSARIAHIDEMRDWLLGKPLRLESGMYGPITAFVSYVALCVQAQRDKAGSTAGIRRLICPADKADYQPDDSDDKTRIDIGLCSMDFDDPAPTASMRTPYHKLLAVVEAKVHSGNFKEAWPQLYGYTRQMYQAQHNLSSAWGFAICGHEVRVCHFGNDVAVSSNPMNVTTPEGRRAFIELLVDWSMCEDFQLGRDPTIVHLPDLDCWQIECPDDTSRGIDTKPWRYYFNEVVCHADHLFGRHTRCFLATATEPTIGSPLVPTVVIKDAWAFAKRSISKDVRDETKMLKKIRATLGQHIKPEDDIIYPEIVVGGRVSFMSGRKRIEDNTKAMYQGSDLADRDPDRFRVHRRIVMSQIGKRLHTLESVDEFLTVVCDVMRCHNAIFEHCQILHRDISDNNILVIKQGGIARGLLIDFDCAIDTSIEKVGTTRPEMTGTLPFMSINNLSESNVTRTVLDDYESLLCLVCWLATLGIGISQHHREGKELEKLPIARWRKIPTGAIIEAKRDHFRTDDSLNTNIAAYFSCAKGSNGASDDPDKKMLTSFVTILRSILFDNASEGVGPECHGTSKIEVPRAKPSWLGTGAEFLSAIGQGALSSVRDKTVVINPFEKRVEKCDIIVKDLLVFIDGFWQFAMERQSNPKSASQEQVETAADDEDDDDGKDESDD
ncbi:hypothetical protein IW146_001416 [Coemansia sp. RSA 922]|nr:hypothetical protein GGH13_000532 [Coemansia sp. S155-1]KAJ2116584.1 hypothetical protein IW146_001416 [Coemansia sp. RSA 922]